ncbi:MAG: TetR/AcrR family transcriptional regulator [Candidatus Dormibacteraceae bacterium]
MPRLSEDARQERRRRLLEAAWRCVARRGYRDVTVDDVCAEAGVSKGAFYVYFENKQDLLLALLDDDSAEVDRRIARLEGEQLTPSERLHRFTRWMLERGADPAQAQLRGDLWAAVVTEERVRTRLSEAIERRRGHLQEWIEEGALEGALQNLPARALASVLLALGDGLTLHAALDASAFRWTRVGYAVGALLTGLERG